MTTPISTADVAQSVYIMPPPGDTPPQEVFLVVHGLNLRPDKMQPWVDWLLGQGFGVVQLVLAGHHGPHDSKWRRLYARNWLADVDHAHLALRTTWPHAKLSLLGFSLGALTPLAWSLEREVPFARTVLLSPAFPLRATWSALLAPLLKWVRLPLIIPSFTPRRYHVHATNSLFAYAALARLKNMLTRKLRQGQHLPPSFVVLQPGDELISVRGWQQNGAAWTRGRLRLYLLHPQPEHAVPRHLAIDAESMGLGPWHELLEALQQWMDHGALP